MQQSRLAALAFALLAGCASGSIDDGAVSPRRLPREDPTGFVPGEASSAADPWQPAPVAMQRLLGWQYQNAVRDLLGATAASKAAPPDDAAVNGFEAIGASQLNLSTSQVVAYEQSAFAAARAKLADTAGRAAFVGCTPKASDDADCMRAFVARFGRLAFRRTLATEEVDSWVAVGRDAGRSFDDFHEGVTFVVAGMLESPSFLFQVFAGEPIPERPGRVRLTGVELATRLSFFLAGTTPSSDLLDAAEAGVLDTDDGVRTWAELLLKKPQARAALTSFFAELFKLKDLENLSKNLTLFPKFTPSLKAAMKQETLLLVEDVVWERNADFRELLDAPYTFVNAELAGLYGLPAPSGTGFAKVTLPPSSLRGGVFGHASLLSATAHTANTSPTLRGKFVREMVMCQAIPAPPPGVDTTLPTVQSGGTTMREKLAYHQKEPRCASCHALMDNIGLGLENFDAIGAFRATDGGQTIDATLTATGLGTFTGARELGTLLRGNERVAGCFVRNVFRHATGHVEEGGEEVVIAQLLTGFADHGYRVKDLLLELATSEAFRTAAAVE